MRLRLRRGRGALPGDRDKESPYRGDERESERGGAKPNEPLLMERSAEPALLADSAAERVRAWRLEEGLPVGDEHDPADVWSFVYGPRPIAPSMPRMPNAPQPEQEAWD